MQDRVLRFIDKQGRITISIVYRGNQLDGEVELVSGAAGIKIIPFKGDGRGKCIRKFDVKDRLQIPAAMRTMFKMGELQSLRPKKAATAKDFINEINGTTKESLMVRSKKEAASVFEKTGQKDKYRETLRLSLIVGCAGAVVGLIMKNLLLAVVLGFGFYYLPLWLTQFYLFSYNKFVSEELEVALSLITTSYTRSNDLVGAIRENIAHVNHPVKEVFISFANNVQYVDSNAAAQIEKMKMALDNKLFHQWCDSLILCQSDHTLRATLIPIVNKFSDLKAQQQENETNMMMPLRKAQFMTILVVGCIPGLYFVNKNWFDNLVGTTVGQIVLTVTAVAVFMMINKAIKLSRPVEYDL